MNTLSGIHGLRAIAALLVIIYHLNQHLPTDSIGIFGKNIHEFITRFNIVVCIFFVLSGFLRSLSYWKKDEKIDEMPKFYPSLRERFLRIAPAYYTMLVISFVVTFIVSGYFSLHFGAFFSGFIFMSWITPDTLFPVLINGPLWFVSFDMIGWILTSVCMWGFFQTPIKRRIYYFPMIILLTLILHYFWINLPWHSGTGISSIWFPLYNPFLFFLHFLFGIFAGYIVRYFQKKQINPSIQFDIGIYISILAIGITLWMIKNQGDWILSIPNGPYHFPWITFLITIIVICLPFSRYIGKYIDNRFLLFTGHLSYSLFLIHALIIELLGKYIFTGNIDIKIWILYSGISIILSYLGAYLLHRYIELPFVRKKTI